MKQSLRTLCLLPLLYPCAAAAGVEEIYEPKVEHGVLEMEYIGNRYGDSHQELENAQGHELELTYGFTERFAATLVFEGERESGMPFKGTGYGGKALYVATSQEDGWWLSSGVFAEYAHSYHDKAGADSVDTRILLSRAAGPWVGIANLGLEREIGGGREHGYAAHSEIRGQYVINKHFAPGIDWQAGYGTTNDLQADEDSEQYLGLVSTGKVAQIGNGAIEYTAGYYWGVTPASAHNDIHVQLAYEMPI